MIIFPFLRVSSAFHSLDGCLTNWGRLPRSNEGLVVSTNTFCIKRFSWGGKVWLSRFPKVIWPRNEMIGEITIWYIYQTQIMYVTSFSNFNTCLRTHWTGNTPLNKTNFPDRRPWPLSNFQMEDRTRHTWAPVRTHPWHVFAYYCHSSSKITAVFEPMTSKFKSICLRCMQLRTKICLTK